MRPLLVSALIALPCFAAPVDGARLARLFGFAGTSAQPKPIDSRPTTPIPFRLLGTLCGERPLAALSTETQTVTVAIGDFVMGAEIVSIEQRQIGVRRSAVIEFLGFSPSIAAPGIATGARVTRREVQQHLAHPEQLIASVRLIPVLAEGKLSGFRALSVAAGSVLETLGLRRGDTLRAVNGVKLDDPSHVMSLYAQLPNARRVDVQLEREGTLITQSLTIDE